MIEECLRGDGKVGGYRGVGGWVGGVEKMGGEVI